jgi:hypothetical protein
VLKGVTTLGKQAATALAAVPPNPPPPRRP